MNHIIRNRIIRSLLLGAAAIFIAGADSQAQQNNLVGVWSTQGHTTRGELIGVYVFSFAADGSFQQRMILTGGGGRPGSTTDYVGRYSLSPDGGTLQLVYLDYQPKQVCGQGFCYPSQPMVRMNAPVTTPIQIIGANQMQTMDGSGPLLWVRQQQ